MRDRLRVGNFLLVGLLFLLVHLQLSIDENYLQETALRSVFCHVPITEEPDKHSLPGLLLQHTDKGQSERHVRSCVYTFRASQSTSDFLRAA
jgi:hypothetical protein